MVRVFTKHFINRNFLQNILYYFFCKCYTFHIFEKNTKMNFPADLKYSKEHEWVRIDGDKATVGITAFAQSELGDIVYVDIDSVGESFEANAIFGSVEAVKTVSDLYLPLSGEILEVNDKLQDAPDLVNSDPYGDGWMVKILATDLSELDSLMDATAYEAMVTGK